MMSERLTDCTQY